MRFRSPTGSTRPTPPSTHTQPGHWRSPAIPRRSSRPAQPPPLRDLTSRCASLYLDQLADGPVSTHSPTQPHHTGLHRRSWRQSPASQCYTRLCKGHRPKAGLDLALAPLPLCKATGPPCDTQLQSHQPRETPQIGPHQGGKHQGPGAMYPGPDCGLPSGGSCDLGPEAPSPAGARPAYR